MEDVLPYLRPLIISLTRYFLFAGAFFLVYYILFPQSFIRNKIQAKWAANKDFIREILHSMQTTLILAAVGLSILRSPLRQHTAVYDDINAFPLWYAPVSIVLALIIHDTYFYWMHRTVHHPKLFKTAHLLHHKSINPSPWASYSFHFTEGFLEALIAPILLFLLPMHPSAFLAFTTLAFLISVYGHLGFEIVPLWVRKTWLFEIINTSVHHNLHHQKFDGNYGLYFRFWDRIMGTEFRDYTAQFDKIQANRKNKRQAQTA
jgi:lathosterol oxidase